MGDVGDERALVVAGERADGVVAAAELDNVAASRDCGVVARARPGRSIGGRSWEDLIYVQHLNVVGHVVDGKRGEGGLEGGGEEETSLRWRMPKKECLTSPVPFLSIFPRLFSACFRPVDLEFRNSRILQCPNAQPHMTKHFPQTASSVLLLPSFRSSC